MGLTLFGHTITWLEVKGFVKEAGAVVGLVVTVAHADHLTAFYSGLGIASTTVLTISHWVNTQTNAVLKTEAPKSP